MIVCEKLANSAYLPLCSIFSNDGHVFRRIENPHDTFTNNTLRTNHAKLQTIWFIWETWYPELIGDDKKNFRAAIFKMAANFLPIF